MKTAITINNLSKAFDGTDVFKNFSLEIEVGKITALFGPNGSGKSTLLDMLSGVAKIDGGSFNIKNFKHKEFSYIFQNYRESLFPWRTNFENVALPLYIQGKKRNEIEKEVRSLQTLFGIEFDWDGYPYAQSGGQQQIIAFLRALITKPKVLFVDEPFSSLDYENNLLLRKHLQTYYLTYKPTVVMITHNVEEAVYLSSKIIVLSQKPTHVVGEAENPLAYPRDIDSMKTEEFHKVKDRVLSFFQKATQI